MSKFSIATPRVEVATDYRLPGRRERFVGGNGEVNSSDRKELMMTIARSLEAAANGTLLVTEEKARSASEVAKLHREMITAAFDDPQQLAEVGQAIADELYVSANKEGFARRLLKRQELVQGQVPQVQLRMKNVMALIASAPTRIETQFIRDNWFYPPEFYISARPFIEKRDIDRTNSDVLEQKYIESLEAIMVGEDRTWRNLALASVGIANESSTIVGNLTPTGLAAVRTLVTRWRVPARNLLIAADLWTDIIGDAGFQNVIDPVSKHDLLLEGEIGRVFGMTITTDAYRHPTQHVLSQGEFWVVGDPVNHGQYTDRGGIESQPIDSTNEHIPGRGWMMTELVSMVVANARSVAYATRVSS